ncbi:MAG: hypothetical protein R3C53_09715 [Pirellulaceae bacterium]
MVYAEQEQPILLINATNHWLTSFPDQPNETAAAFDFRGRAWTQLETYDLAVRNFTKSLEIKENNAVRERRAFANYRLENWQAVIDDADLILGSDPDRQRAEFVRAMALGLDQQYELALTATAQLLDESRTQPLDEQDTAFLKKQVETWKQLGPQPRVRAPRLLFLPSAVLYRLIS